MKAGLGVIFVVLFAGLTVLGLNQPGGGGVVFIGLVGLFLTIVVVWRERFSDGLSYVFIALGMLRALFPVATCVPYGYDLRAARALGYTANLPWDCDVQVRPLAGITAVQAIVLIGVGAWWLWWRKVGARSPSGPASLGGRESRRGGILVRTPSCERAISEEEAQLAASAPGPRILGAHSAHAFPVVRKLLAIFKELRTPLPHDEMVDWDRLVEDEAVRARMFGEPLEASPAFVARQEVRERHLRRTRGEKVVFGARKAITVLRELGVPGLVLFLLLIVVFALAIAIFLGWIPTDQSPV